MRYFILAFLVMVTSAALYGQCGSAGHLIINPLTGIWDCTANTGVPPSGTAGGVLGGTFPDPTFKNSLTTSTIPKINSGGELVDSTITDDGTIVKVGAQFDIKANPFIIELPNSSTGTTNNKLVKTVVNGGVLQAQIITTSSADQLAAIGCVLSGGGTTGSALIIVYGAGSCHFDGATTANHVAVPSSTSAGALHDTGSDATPTSGAGLAVIGSTNACGSPPCLVTGNLFAPLSLLAPGSAGPGGGGGQGNSSFKNIRSGTNDSAAMVCTTGCSLDIPTQSQNNNSTKAASTAYTDLAVSNAVAGINPAVAVLAASTATVVGTYANGASGIGATFTVTATGAFTLDGISISTIGQRVLLKDQTTGFQNGVYTATVVGASLVSPVFTRALDYNQPSDINNTGIVPVQSGTVNALTGWLLTSNVTAVGTDALVYSQFSSGGTPGASIISIALPVGVCQGTTATSGFSLPNSNAPTTNCITGSNVNMGELLFPAGVTSAAQYQILAPYNIDCTAAMNIAFTWRAAAITNSVTWGVQTAFVAPGAVLDAAWNTATTVAHAPQGTTLQIRTDTTGSITKTGCAAGSEMFIKIYRDSADTMTGNAELLSAQLQYSRTY